MTRQKHTPPPPAAPIIERKIKPGGEVREYPCTLLHMDTRLAVVRFVMARGGVITGTPVEVPPGSVSDGYFWKRRPFNAYRMRRADGSLIAHRFDAVSDVRFSPEAVVYRDLALDWWVTPDGLIIEEDRDELDALVASGALSPADLLAATNAAQQVFSRYRHIIDELEMIERTLGIAIEAAPFS